MQEKHASGMVFPLMPQGLVHGWSLFPGHLCFPPLLKKKIVSTENREKSISVWARTQNFTWRKMIHPVFQGNGKSRRGSRCAEKLLGRHRRGAYHSQRGPPPRTSLAEDWRWQKVFLWHQGFTAQKKDWPALTAVSRGPSYALHDSMTWSDCPTSLRLYLLNSI